MQIIAVSTNHISLRYAMHTSESTADTMTVTCAVTAVVVSCA
jgi:hypothetical protein